MSRFGVLTRRKKYSIHTAARQIAEFFIHGIASLPPGQVAAPPR